MSDDDARAKLSVAVDALRPRVRDDALACASTADVPPLDSLLGQQEALEALDFGIDVRGQGFNLYVAGEKGSGRTTTVRAHLDTAAAARPAPVDWVYAHHFDAIDRPIAISMPSGTAATLAKDLGVFAREAARAMRRAFDSDDHDRRRRAALDDVVKRRNSVVAEAMALGREHGFDVEFSPGAVASNPLVDGQPLTEERFDAMSADERAALARRTEDFEILLGGIARRLRPIDSEEDERTLAFDREAGRAALEPLLADLRAKYAHVPAIVEHLDRVGADLSEHARAFVPSESVAVAVDDERDTGPRQQRADGAVGDDADNVLARVRVNVLVDHGGARCAPVVVETHATPSNLTGRIDYRMTSTGLVADFLQVRAGALHRANGGYLVLRAEDVLQTPSSWEVLKRALTSREICVDAGGDEAPLPATALRPAAIPLDVKVVLVGTADLYQTLFELDPDFRELFKVKVEFAPDLPWSNDAVRLYAGFLSRCVRDRGLLPLDASAIARTIEHGARLCGDQTRLSTRLGEIGDLVTEASHRAGRAGRAEVTKRDVDEAVHARHARSGLFERRMIAEIARGTVLVETSGTEVGQVNGLTVFESGDARFGLPARITATTSPGYGAVLSIEREVELGGPIHSKGVLTLRGYLARMYAADGPLQLSATLAFEQSYGEIEGDSASLAELLALLSALAGIPIEQGIAVTGSIDQRGQVQPVGEVSRKVEGFFATCAAAGLTGSQGVIVPARNAVNLVLDDAVVDAVRDGRFHVWSVRTVDDALLVMTGRHPGAVDADGRFDTASLHGRVLARIQRYARQLEVSGKPPG